MFYKALFTIALFGEAVGPMMNTVELSFGSPRARNEAKYTLMQQYEREGYAVTWVEFLSQ